MKTRFLSSALLLSLFATVGYAGTNIEELKAQERAKREQLSVLGEKIKQLEEEIAIFKQKKKEFEVVFIEEQKRQFLSENPGIEFSEKIFNDECIKHFSWLIEESTGLKGVGPVILEDAFEGIESGPVFKFYIIKYTHDVAELGELLSEWKKLSDECFAIARLTKGL